MKKVNNYKKENIKNHFSYVLIMKKNNTVFTVLTKSLYKNRIMKD